LGAPSARGAAAAGRAAHRVRRRGPDGAGRRGGAAGTGRPRHPGPRGRLVGVERSYGQTPLFTRETWQGVRTVELSDPFVDSGVRVLKDAMYELNQAHGDGAATLAVMAEATLREARRHLAAGVSQAGLRRGLEQARRVALEA